MKKPEFVVIPLTYTEKRNLVPSDHEAIDVYTTEDPARARVRENLGTGDEVVGLYKLVGLYRVKNLDIEEVK